MLVIYICCCTAFSSLSVRQTSPPFTEEHGGGLPDLPRGPVSPCQHQDANLRPPHSDTILFPLFILKSCFTRHCEADCDPTTIPPGCLGSFSTFTVPLPGRKESPRPQRLFNVRGSFSSFQFNKYLSQIYSVPHFALESTALGPTICGKEKGYDRLNVCVPLPKKILVC